MATTATIADYNNHPVATAESNQKSCGLLELPPELRNNIYELCFESVIDDKRVKFNAPTPPEFAILQTCRQFRDEATQIFQVADREYWSNTNFWIERKTCEKMTVDVESMRSEKVHLMNKITIENPSEESPGSIRCLKRYLQSGGVTWAEPRESGNDPRFFKLIRLYKKGEQLQLAEQKYPTKQELLDVISALKGHWAIAK
ncbi:hypothetical protein D0863_00706 [Hortaea werneckii]|uniref:F-box domain-containing protein n=1 Tax=Hortaea werneckii TaxID=91943 RepID=A0A3M7EP86_HORWE|nr:hypothetical protein D0863_00706 [Hortaea werneckii]